MKPPAKFTVVGHRGCLCLRPQTGVGNPSSTVTCEDTLPPWGSVRQHTGHSFGDLADVVKIICSINWPAPEGVHVSVTYELPCRQRHAACPAYTATTSHGYVKNNM